MEAYLDNSATTRCSKDAADMVMQLLTQDYGNPSSMHNKGVIAENYMNDARKKIAKTLKCRRRKSALLREERSLIILQLLERQRQIKEAECM